MSKTKIIAPGSVLHSSLKRAVSIVLILVLISNQLLAAPQMPQMLVGAAATTWQDARFWLYANGWMTALAAIQGKISDKPTKPNPKQQETQEERNARVFRIQIFPDNAIVPTGEPITFSAIAYDQNNNPIGGVQFKWSGNDEGRGREMSISPRGVFASPVAGKYNIRVEGAGRRTHTKVTVVGATIKPDSKKGDPTHTKPTSTRDLPIRTSQTSYLKPSNRTLQGKMAYAGKSATALRATKSAITRAPMLFQSGDPYGWNDNNYMTADDSGAERGDMPGHSADGGAGSGNFQFSAPVFGLDGRGIDLSLALSYNSRVWHKAGSEITFDIDRDWPAPGWSLGFGKIISMGTSSGYMMIDVDGTRHGYTGTVNNYSSGGYSWQQFNGYTVDGTFIDYFVSGSVQGVPSYASVKLANGTIITYGASGDNAVYPTQILDPNGNYTTITYVNNQGPRINTVTETLGRVVQFHYDSNNLLTAITAPGFNTGTTRELVRLQYQQHTLSYNYTTNPTPKVRTGTVWLVKAIYYPATATGYWFGENDSYSSYGMLRRIIEHRGMTFSGAAVTSQGTITAGTISREVAYNYPQNPDYTLTDAPTYTEMKEQWAGMDPGAPGITNGWAVTAFSVVEETSNARRRTTITRPDGTKHVQYAYILPGNYQDGLVFYDKICTNGMNCEYNDPGLRASSVTWEQGAYSSPRPSFTHTYYRPNQTPRLTSFTYGSSYNQVTETKEYDYDGNLYRKTVNEYENSSGYINRHIFNLVKNTEVRDAAGNRIARTEYLYDGGTLADAPNVTQHSLIYDPYDPGYQNCGWVWNEQLQDYEYQCNWVYDYDPATDKRGLVTEVKRFADALSLNGAITETRAYDKTGNLRTASTACCEQSSFTYTINTQFAWPENQKSGSPSDPNLQNTTSAVYSFNTGLVTQTTDTNGRTSITQYYASTTRPQYTWSPTGAYTHHVYDDGGLIVYDRAYDSLGSLSSGSDKYLDGYGRVHGEVAYGAGLVLDIVNTKFDALGRVWKQTRPYRYGDTPQWYENQYDALDRITQTTTVINSQTEYLTRRYYDDDATAPSAAVSGGKGNTALVKDQWNRERWARFDWDNRLIEIIEPDPSGSGAVASNGLRTEYQYDVLGNLTRTIQGDQERIFKFDSLSRLTRQKLAERSATLNEAGTHVGSGQWSDVFTYDSRSNLTQHVDARGVVTTFNYNNDPLNRLQSVSYNKSGAPQAASIIDAATVNYAYETSNDLTRIKQITDGAGTVALTYDVEGRLCKEKRTFSGRTSYPLESEFLYDTLDRVKEIKYPKQYGVSGTPQKIVQVTYDEASRLTSLTYDSQSFASQIAYNAASQTTSLNVGNNAGNQLSETYTYDPATGLLTNQKVLKASAAQLDLNYDYLKPGTTVGRTGQLTRITNILDQNKNKYYQYDALGRLLKVNSGSDPVNNAQWWQQYSYDRYGNRTMVEKGGSQAGTVRLDAAAASNSVNQFTLSYTDGQGKTLTNRITSANYTYDDAGNQTKGQTENGDFNQYQYDAAGRLAKVLNAAGTATIAEYGYGANNQRLKQVEYGGSGSATTYFAWNGDAVIAEYTEPSGQSALTWSKSYVYLGGRLLATETGAATHFHHPDRLGTRFVTNAANSNTVAEQTTLPFGRALDAESSGAVTNRRFTSYDRSATTGMDYAVNRFYNSAQGRFTQVDPIGMSAVSLSNPQSLNLYGYCENDPINHVDPDGLFLGKLFGWIGNAIKKVAKVFAVVLAVAAVLAFSFGFPAIGVAALIGSGIYAAIGWGSGKLSEFAGAFLGTLSKGGNFRTPPINGGASVSGVSNFLQQNRRPLPPFYGVVRRLAISAIRAINARSRRQNMEYGGEICRDANGRIYSTPARIGSVAGFNPQPCPNGEQKVGQWHTHGGNDHRYDNENFSGIFGGQRGDIPWAERNGLPLFLGTPGRQIKVYIPDSSIYQGPSIYGGRFITFKERTP